jgi:hypothetical protein
MTQRWIVASLAATQLSGCSLISGIVQKSREEQIEKLEAAGDYEGLRARCQEGSNKACDASHRVGWKRLAQADCDGLVDDVSAYYINHEGTREGDAELIRKFHGCQQLPELFARDFEIRWLSDGLADVDRGGTDVFGPFLAFLGGTPDPYAKGSWQAERMAKWLVSVGDAQRCAPLAEHVPKVGDDARGEFVWVFYELGCGEQALPYGTEFVHAAEPGRRIQGCDVLGKFGDGSTLQALEILAQTDPYKEQHEVRMASGAIGMEVVHPVRERCLAAAGQVRLRGG